MTIGTDGRGDMMKGIPSKMIPRPRDEIPNSSTTPTSDTRPAESMTTNEPTWRVFDTRADTTAVIRSEVRTSLLVSLTGFGSFAFQSSFVFLLEVLLKATQPNR